MNIEKTQVFGFEAALRGMRNPLDSWVKSDSKFGLDNGTVEGVWFGANDQNLATRLINAGTEHCKFLRQIHVWVDLTLPRYIWSEFDTYKFNTVNSCSTMHTIHRRLLTQEDFESHIGIEQIGYLNDLIALKKAGDIDNHYFIHTIKNNLPEGFLQKRTVSTNYAELINIYHQRKSHKLDQWHKICEWIEQLPYMSIFLGGVPDEEK